MILSHLHKFIYIAVPKTGTTSIQKHVESLNLTEIQIYNLRNDDKLPDGMRFRKHMKASYLKNDINEFDKYFKFTFVRNPYDRVVSWVYYYLRNNKINLHKHSFKELIFKCPEYIWECQCDFIFDDAKNLMNFVGKTENLQEDFNTICDKIGIPQKQLPHKNKSKHKHYTEYYDDETREIVAEKYAKDIEYFGYEFGE